MTYEARITTFYFQGHETNLHAIGKGDVPLIVLHGGPGAGTTEASVRALFTGDLLAKYTVYYYDQRGAETCRSHSTKEGIGHPILRRNNIDTLANDLDAIITEVHRHHHKRYPAGPILFGGSWGTTLALYYAKTFGVTKISSMLLRGLFLNDNVGNFLAGSGLEEATHHHHPGFFRNHGAHYATMWKEFTRGIKLTNEPATNRLRIVDYYYRKITLATKLDKATAQAIFRFNQFATFLANGTILKIPATTVELIKATRVDWKYYRIGLHFHQHLFGLDKNWLDGPTLAKLRNTNIKIVHGDADGVCPVTSARELSAQIGDSCQLYEIKDGGHPQGDPLILETLQQILTRTVEAAPKPNHHL